MVAYRNYFICKNSRIATSSSKPSLKTSTRSNEAPIAQLDAVCKPETIFASNTSSLSITADDDGDISRASATFHWHALLQSRAAHESLVEVVRTILTDEDVCEDAVAFGKKLGKVPVRASDKTGFIVNRLLVPYMLGCDSRTGRRVGSDRRHRQCNEDWAAGTRWARSHLAISSDSIRPYYIAEIMSSMSFAKSSSCAAAASRSGW